MPDQEWRELCELASKEMDPDKLMDIVKRLNDVLEHRERQLRDRLKPAHDLSPRAAAPEPEPESTL